MRVIVISGGAGVGKTTVGRRLAARLRLPLLDLDTLTNPLLDAIAPRLAAAVPAGELSAAEAPTDEMRAGEVLADQVPVSGGSRHPVHWNDPRLRELIRPARYAALRAAIVDQSHLGAIAVAPFTAELAGGDEWRELVEACGGEPQVVWLHAPAALVADRRAERADARDQHALDASDAFRPAVPHLAVEATASPEELVEAVLRSLRR